MEFRAAFATDSGRVRENNEDAVLADLPLIAVADGMGGYEGGEVASALALETLRPWRQRLEQRSSGSVADTLREAFNDVNRVVRDKARSDEQLSKMGTTLTAGWIDGTTIALAHVGDSRAYLLRGATLQQLTQDQTVAQEWVRRGRLSEDEAASSPHRNMLLQAIGSDFAALDIETSTVKLRPGDRLLFATDGLYGMLTRPDEIKKILVDHLDPDEACATLIDAANAAGGGDNISVLLVDVEGDAGDPAETTDDHPPIVVEKTVTGKQPATSRSSLWTVGAVGAVTLVVLAAVFFILRPTKASYVVSARNGQVVVLNGHPGADDKPAKGKIVRVFANQPVDHFNVITQQELRRGFPVESIAEAQRLIDRLPRLLGPRDTPTPTPKPAGTATPTPKVGATLPTPTRKT